jgi:flagellar basal-body rod modification protein FlgD
MNISNVKELISSGTSSTASTAGKKTGDDKELFLKLLVAQMKNQDPLAPQDSTQYVAQLAQFSSLEQLTSINDRLNTLIDLGNK